MTVNQNLVLMEVPAGMKLVRTAVTVCQDGLEPTVNQILELVRIGLARMTLLVLISSKITSVCK